MLSPTTELEAINSMLSAIGEAPVNTVEDSGVVDAVMARNILRSVSREVQSRGWHWNTEKGMRITPTFPDKELRLPRTVLRADTVGSFQSIDVVVRGERLYDRRNHTYQFTQPVEIDMIVLLNFDELPEAARVYITLRASRKFAERLVGSGELSNFIYKDEIQSLVSLQEHESDIADLNMFSDSYSVARVLHR